MTASRDCLRRILFEWRFKPTLSFYGRMDDIGVSYLDEFPDWRRSPLALELRNRVRHERLHMSFTRCFYEAYGPLSPVEQCERGVRFMTQVCERLEIDSILRLGILRTWAAPVNSTFPALVEEFATALLPDDSVIKGLLSDEVRDPAITIDFNSPDGWPYDLRAGPMEKKQYFGVVDHDKTTFAERGAESGTFRQYQESFPDLLVYLEIDSFRLNLQLEEAGSFIEASRAHTADAADRILKHFG